MFSYQLGFFELNEIHTNIDVFGYPISVMEKHNLDLKDMLFIHDYSIPELGASGLKRRINILISKKPC